MPKGFYMSEGWFVSAVVQGGPADLTEAVDSKPDCSAPPPLTSIHTFRQLPARLPLAPHPRTHTP